MTIVQQTAQQTLLPLAKSIKISRFGSGWQALVAVTRPEYTRLPGVKGALTDTGAWIGAEGSTPSEALAGLYAEIGRVLLPLLLEES